MKNMVGIIQARVNSTRLPNKVLLDLKGKTVMERVIERVQRSRLVEDVIVATTMEEQDLELALLCEKRGVKVYRGSEEDVLDRYYQAARVFLIKDIVRITADCPLIDPMIIDEAIGLYTSMKADYVSNALRETFPDGEDVEVFSFETLENAWKNAKLYSEREHVTSYIRKHPEFFKIENLICKQNLSQKRWTLDEKKDYEFIKLIYENLYNEGDGNFGMREILEFLKRYPECEKINSGIKRNEGYMKSLQKDKIFDGN